MHELLQPAVLEYVLVVDELYGHYLDSTAGFAAMAKQVAELQEKSRNQLPLGTDQDSRAFFYGNGDPNSSTSRVQHVTTQAAYKARNAKNGPNCHRAAQLLIVLLFEYWESEHRAHIASALQLNDQSDLKIPIIGDLRALRQDVIHHRGIIRVETTRKLTVLSGFAPGEMIRLNGDQVESIVLQLKAALDTLVVQAGLPDPYHRRTWRVQ